MDDYSAFDDPGLIAHLFYPRSDQTPPATDPSIRELIIPVEDGIHIGGKLFVSGGTAPSILFFHGNGEIVNDYNDLGPLFRGIGINFIPVDYRGYGRSNGTPSVSSMMSDCHSIYTYLRRYLDENGFTGKFIIMGRSLGSASALELVSSHPEEVDGLIIDSGFAFVLPLLRVIGIQPDRLGLREEEGFRNFDKIKKFIRPTLIIHAEHDQIIPYHEGRKLYESSPAKDKKLLTIPHADHNTIFMYGLNEYMAAITALAVTVRDAPDR